MRKRMMSLLLALAMIFAFCPTMALSASAETGLVRGTYTFAPHTVTGRDLTDSYVYTDDFFTGSSYTDNEHLATMSMMMASASISSQQEGIDYENKSRNIQALLKALDFQDVTVNEYYKQRPQEQSMGVAVAHKNITDDHGSSFVLLAVVPRSAGYEREWVGNFTVGDAGLHQGFETARDIVVNFTKTYIANHKSAFDNQTVKLWTMGYSRGAAVANLTGAQLVDEPEILGLGVTIAPENVFTYCFGTPLTAPKNTVNAKFDPQNAKYSCIHNYFAEYDPVTMMPLTAWEFSRYGTVTNFNVYSATAKSAMLHYLQQVNPTIYDIYTAAGSGADPDNFSGKTMTLVNGSVSMVADATATVGIGQKAFFEQRFDYLNTHLIGNRTGYAANYQSMIQVMATLYYGMTDEESSAFFGGIKENPNAIPLVVLLYSYQLAKNADAASILSALNTLENQMGDTVDTLEKNTDYANIKAALQSSPENLLSVQASIKSLAVEALTRVLASGLDAINAEDTQRFEVLDAAVIAPLTEFLACLLFGTDNPGDSVVGLASAQMKTAATLLGNAGSYMRVHNNEIILSWLKTQDSYYAFSTQSDDTPPSYTLSFDANGGSAVSAVSMSSGASVDLSKYATVRKGYVFTGWYSDKVLTQPITSVKLNANITVYAGWSRLDPFADVSEEDWFFEAVSNVFAKGLMYGTGKTTFSPHAATTRGMLVAVLYRLERGPEITDGETFEDVPDKAYYSEPVLWARGAGIVAGYANGSFGPDDNLTREQFAVLLWRYVQYKGYDVSIGENTSILSYDDALAVSEYAIPAMQWACAAGLIQGVENNLMPQAEMTRAQMAVVLHRFLTGKETFGIL